MTADPPDEYRIQRLQEALASDPRVGELGLEVISSEEGVSVRGVVGSDERRDAVAVVAREAMPGIAIKNETTVKRVRAPRPEENIS